MRNNEVDGCEFITLYMEMPITCGKCPIRDNCLYDIVDKGLIEATDALVRAKRGLREPVESMKGHECLYKDNLFCSEGVCRDCEIWIARGKK